MDKELKTYQEESRLNEVYDIFLQILLRQLKGNMTDEE